MIERNDKICEQETKRRLFFSVIFRCSIRKAGNPAVAQAHPTGFGGRFPPHTSPCLGRQLGSQNKKGGEWQKMQRMLSLPVF
jgi:hypothetical protein